MTSAATYDSSDIVLGAVVPSRPVVKKVSDRERERIAQIASIYGQPLTSPHHQAPAKKTPRASRGNHGATGLGDGDMSPTSSPSKGDVASETVHDAMYAGGQG